LSLKENIDMVKDELSQEEKLFAGAVQTERFVKKYKLQLISALVAIVLILVSNSIYQASLEQAIESSNEAYLTLLSNSEDEQAAKVLQENNPALYDAWMFKVAVEKNDEATLDTLSSSKSSVVADLASYELAALKKDKTALNEYSLNQDAILKDLAILNEAVLLMQEGKTQEAKRRLALIDESSSLNKLAMLLQHYGTK
jgi:hypothetical protein